MHFEGESIGDGLAVLEFLLSLSFVLFRVRLAVNRKTQEAVAVKIVNADKLGNKAENKDNLKKEVCISFFTTGKNLETIYRKIISCTKSV